VQDEFSVNGSDRFRSRLVPNLSHAIKRIVKMSVTSIPATGVPLCMGFVFSGSAGLPVVVQVVAAACALLALRSLGLRLRQVGK
jgi:hypothetical protein